MVNGIPMVNSENINESSNAGSLLVYDSLDFADFGISVQELAFKSVSMITGSSVGQHWIVPGSYISRNFNITYSPGELHIDRAELTIDIEDLVVEELAETYTGNVVVAMKAYLEDAWGGKNWGLTHGTIMKPDCSWGGHFGYIELDLSKFVQDTINLIMSTHQVLGHLIISYSEGILKLTAQSSRGEKIHRSHLFVGSREELDAYLTDYACPSYYNFPYSTEESLSSHMYEVTAGTPVEPEPVLPEIIYSMSGYAPGDSAFIADNLNFIVHPEFTGEPGTYTISAFASFNNYALQLHNGLLTVTEINSSTKKSLGIGDYEAEMKMADMDILEEGSAEFLVYPNPSSDKVYLQFSDLLSSDRINVLDLNGRMVDVEYAYNGIDQFEINVSPLKPGYYFIRMERDSSIEMLQFIKQ